MRPSPLRGFAATAYPARHDRDLADLRWRHRFAWLTLLTTGALIGWGAFVTSIDAGLAVPDWPSSFNSYDPFNPWPGWWDAVPVRAEHGHRLMGALVGLLTLTLTGWTLLRDRRRWMKGLAVGLLLLVSLQGLLGGLRVVWVSLDLAVVHALTAQLYTLTLVSYLVFSSPTWAASSPFAPDDRALRRLSLLRSVVTALVPAVFVQIGLGAMLRHPGTGIDPFWVTLHIAGAVGVLFLVLWVGHLARRAATVTPAPAQRVAWLLQGLVVAQWTLGLTAWLVTLNEQGEVIPSNLQVLVNSAHVVIGAALFGSAGAVGVWAWRRPALFAAGDGQADEAPLLRTSSPATA